MRSFIVIGQRATASADFSIDDVPGTGGRLDVLLRCLRAALLVSHGVRRDTRAYLVLLGGASAPRALRVDGSVAEYLRPDERSLATLVKKALAGDMDGPGFVAARHGVAIAHGGLEAVLTDLGAVTPYVLEQGAPDLRGVPLAADDAAFFVGDHLGFGEEDRARIASIGATPVGLGPVGVHAEDAIAIVANELDRRAQSQRESMVS